MKPLTREEAKVCEALFLIPHYPKDYHHVVLDDIAKFAAARDRGQGLEWLVRTARAAMSDGWRDQLRGLWCTRFPPADGIEVDCSLAGHTPGDIEAENLLRHEQWKALEKSDKSHAGLLPVTKIHSKPN